MPQGGMQSLLEKDPLEILAWQFDMCAMVLNFHLVLLEITREILWLRLLK